MVLSARELVEALRDTVGMLDDDVLRQMMDIAECEIVNRMAAKTGYAYVDDVDDAGYGDYWDQRESGEQR